MVNLQFNGNKAIFAVAPMMGYTDRHCRKFHRLLSRHALLYSEMITANAIIFGDRNRLLAFEPDTNPVALQLGGCDPRALARAGAIGAEFGYSEINLNVGCPSPRVKSGQFGACLMLEPGLVGECVSAIKAQVSIPVTVKCRLGVDDQNIETALDDVVDNAIEAKAETVIVHARKALLDGINARQNRHIPPLNYDRVYRLKQRVSDRVKVIVNGGIDCLADAARIINNLDGVMLGRAAYHNPRLLTEVDRYFAPAYPAFSHAGNYYSSHQYQDKWQLLLDAIVDYADYAGVKLAGATAPVNLAKPLIGLFNNMTGARQWRRLLTGNNRGIWPDDVISLAAEIIDLQQLAEDQLTKSRESI